MPSRSRARAVPRGATTLDVLIDQYTHAKKLVDEATSVLDPIKHAILKETTRLADEEGRYATKTHTLKIRRDSMQVLSQESLLQLGVSPRIIRKATKTVEKSAWVQITKRKSDTAEGRDEERGD